MAKKKAALKAEDTPYIASNLDITYTIPVGLTAMLSRATKTSDKEVWCKLSEITNVCAARIMARFDAKSFGQYSNSASSWIQQDFPGSSVKLRIDMDGYLEKGRYDHTLRQMVEYDVPKKRFNCRIKISGSSTEKFSQSQIDNYLMDKMEAFLFGDEGVEQELEDMEKRFNIKSSEENNE